MRHYLEVHGLELVSALAALTAAIVSVLVYRRQSTEDSSVGWLLERDDDHQITLVRTGGGTAFDLVYAFDANALTLVEGSPRRTPVGPGARLFVARTAPRSAFVAPGIITVTWRQKRLLRNTNHTWTSELP